MKIVEEWPSQKKNCVVKCLIWDNEIWLDMMALILQFIFNNNMLNYKLYIFFFS